MLPPGPRYPVAVQTLGWIARPGPFMERCRDRYGDAFSLRMYNEGTWVMFSDPAAVKQIFTGDPKLLHSGEANGILRPIVGPNSVLLLDDRAHMTQRKPLRPPFHGERMKAYGVLMAEAEEARALSEAVLAIRQFGSTRSINAAAASAVAMHEWVRRWAPER